MSINLPIVNTRIYIYMGGFLSHVMWYPQVTMGFNKWSNDSGVPAESRFCWDESRFAAAWDLFAVPNKS